MIDLGLLFKPLTLLINKRIAEQTPARQLADSLNGESMAVRVRDTSLAIYLSVEQSRLGIHTRYADEPAVVLTGSPLSLAALAGKDPQGVIRDGHVQMSGDAMLGAKFQQLLKYAQPDLEDELAGVVGDIAANQAGNIARGLAGVAGDLSDRFHNSFGEYLTEDRQSLPSQEQFAGFRSDVERLRDDVARADARLKLLQTRYSETN